MGVVGKPVVRADGLEKVTGRARFVADLAFPAMLHARVIRSTVPHGRIRHLDLEQARAVPGVVRIALASDIPGENIIPVVLRDQPCLAEGTVRYLGEAIGLIAATSLQAADEALRRVRIDYDLLPALLDPARSRHPESPRLFGTDNVFKHLSLRKGNPEKAFAKADLVLERHYRTPAQEHAYLETQGAVVVPQPDGGLDVHGAMQCPFYVQEGVAEVLGLSLNRVRVIQCATGGGFGGKEDFPSMVAAQAAILAHLIGRPVKLVYDRDEDMLCTSKRHPAVIRFKTGATRDGRLVAAEVEYLMDGGAYATLSPVVALRGTIHAAGPYRIDDICVETRAVATNRVPSGAFRGFGEPQVAFACECQMDEMARRLGLDPLEMRRRNLLREGGRTATGQLLAESVGLEECLEKVAEACDYGRKAREWGRDQGVLRRGIGLSTVYYGMGLGAGGAHMARTGSHVQLCLDGSALFAVGTTEIGQGMRTVLSQIVADELGIPYDAVRMMPSDTSRIPDSGPTVASRTTTMSGNSLRQACKPIRATLLATAAGMTGHPVEELRLEDGWLVHAPGEKRLLPYTEVVQEAGRKRENLTAVGWYQAAKTDWDAETGQGHAYLAYAFAANAVEVEVDVRTGQVRVTRITAAHDVGRAINPQGVEGQIEGGAVQGLGYGLFEEVLTSGGGVGNHSFSTYILPTTLDTPEIEPIIVESAYRDGPHGAKGFGEQPLIGIAPALRNAILHATGVLLYQVPVTPERVLKALGNPGDEP